MKMKVNLMLAVSVLVLSAGAFAQEQKPDPKFHIYLCFGQSNMEAGARPDEQDRGELDPRFQMLAAVDMPRLNRTKGNWYLAMPPLNRQENNMGPVDWFGRNMVANLPKDIRVGVINVSVAGAGIELWDKDNWETYLNTREQWMKNIVKQYNGSPYQRLVEMAKIAQKDGVIKGILLHQGESNSSDTNWPAKVKGIYDNLMKDLDLNPKDVPLLAGELKSQEEHGVCFRFNTNILAHLPELLPNSHIISSQGVKGTPDQFHFNTAGMRELGKRYAIQMLKLEGIEFKEVDRPGLLPAAATPLATGSAAPAAPAGVSNTASEQAQQGGRRGGPNFGPLPEIHAPVPNTLPGLLGKLLQWKSTGVLVRPQNDPTHFLYSVKDPTIFRYQDKWEVYATAFMVSGPAAAALLHPDTNLPAATPRRGGGGGWSMVHLSFADWKDAPNAKLFYLDTVPGFGGYKCAPEVFYFAPQKTWYYIFQTQRPAYCTSETPDDPKSWTTPQQFFTPDIRTPGLPIDYHCIGDGEHMYLFFTGDDGNFYRSQTTYAEFPKGFSNPVVAMRGTRSTVFEASFTYKIKGVDKYLTCVEALSPTRYYRAYVADKLDGEWYPVAGFDTFEKPFAGIKNMTFDEGVEPWSGQVSHGEMVREGNDERMILDPDNLLFFYQGIADADNRGDYGRLPYRLGLLRAVKDQ
jgi:hypothetical protein